jgi:hypothetical protein
MVKGRESCANVASRVGLGTQRGSASHGSGLVPLEWLQCEDATKVQGHVLPMVDQRPRNDYDNNANGEGTT